MKLNRIRLGDYISQVNLKNRKDFMKTAVRELGSEEARAQAADEYDYFKEIGLV